MPLQDTLFALIGDGKGFLRDLEANQAIALRAPLEGGFEGRYIRRARASGYKLLSLSARGLGDPDAYLTGVHGVRPAHLGKQDIRTFFVPPIVGTQLATLPASSKGLLLWILEGVVLSRQELSFLHGLAQKEPRLKIVVELGGDRAVRWEPLANLLTRAA